MTYDKENMWFIGLVFIMIAVFAVLGGFVIPNIA